MTQVDINNAVNQVVNQLTGQSAAMPNGSYKGQCTVPAVKFVMEATGLSFEQIPPMAGDSAMGWGLSFPEALDPFFTVEPYQAGKAYPKGTLLLWDSPHIAIVLSPTNGNEVDVFEQNADPDGSPCHTATRTIDTSTHTCKFALVPVVTAEPSTPAPAPASTPSAVSASGNYVVTKAIQGFSDANNAANHLSPTDTVQPRSYAIFNEADGMINVTATAGQPGSWINPADNEATEPAKVVTVQAGWGLEAIAQAGNMANAGQEATWQVITKANGGSDWRAFNAALKPGQKVIIPQL